MEWKRAGNLSSYNPTDRMRYWPFEQAAIQKVLAEEERFFRGTCMLSQDYNFIPAKLDETMKAEAEGAEAVPKPSGPLQFSGRELTQGLIPTKSSKHLFGGGLSRPRCRLHNV